MSYANSPPKYMTTLIPKLLPLFVTNNKKYVTQAIISSLPKELVYSSPSSSGHHYCPRPHMPLKKEREMPWSHHFWYNQTEHAVPFCFDFWCRRSGTLRTLLHSARLALLAALISVFLSFFLLSFFFFLIHFLLLHFHHILILIFFFTFLIHKWKKHYILILTITHILCDK